VSTLRVGIYDEFFRATDVSMTHQQPLPDDFEYIDGCDDPDRVDIVLATVFNLDQAAASRHPRRVYYLQETTACVPTDGEDRYRHLALVLTNDARIVERHANARYVPFVGTTITDCAPVEKTRNISMIASARRLLPGHKLRHRIAADASIMASVDGYGAAFEQAYLTEKYRAFADYRFAIAIENARYPWYVTEKLFDCFATGTVPLYWGRPDRLPEIGFDPDGILEWSTLDELRDMVARLARHGPEIYEALEPAVARNQERCRQLRCHEMLLGGLLREHFAL
jgi:hypothetical protein